MAVLHWLGGVAAGVLLVLFAAGEVSSAERSDGVPQKVSERPHTRMHAPMLLGWRHQQRPYWRLDKDRTPSLAVHEQRFANEAASAAQDAPDDDVYVPTRVPQRLGAFDWQLARALDRAAPANAVVSPAGVRLLLGLLQEAAAGDAGVELRRAVALPPSAAAGRRAARRHATRALRALQEKKEGYIMTIGTKVFLDKTFEPHPNISNIYKTYYGANIEGVDFKTPSAVRPIINEWVSNLTNGHIHYLITNDLQVTNLLTMMINVIYFKGDWLYSFPKKSTQEGPFEIAEGKTVMVDYMHLTKNFYYAESQQLDAKILRLPYKGKKFSMFLILPKKRENFEKMMQLVSPALVRKELYSLEKLEVKVKIPKFQFQYTVHLKELLQKLGISRIFTQSDEINLTKNKTNIMISKVVQKSVFEVNEEGTEASSATEIDIENHFGGQIIFQATHPFLFFVEDERTGTVIFIGKVIDPRKVHSPKSSTERPEEPGNTWGNVLKKDFQGDISMPKLFETHIPPLVPFPDT